MGRKPTVSQEDIISVIEKYIDRFSTTEFPQYGDSLWQKMSHDLDGRLIPRSIYTHLKYDKRGDLSQARRNKGISVAPKIKSVRIDDQPESEDEEVFDLQEDYVSQNLTLETRPDFQTFELRLSNEDWSLIKPDKSNSKTRLKKETWTSVTTRAFYNKYAFSCAYLGKYSYVCPNFDPKKNKNYLKFMAYCKDQKNCKNILIGTASEKPDKKGLTLKIMTRDTRRDFHVVSKRPVRGWERKQVGKKLEKQTAANYREELLRNEMKFGDDIPPHVQENNIYRQIKTEREKEKLGLHKKDKNNVIKFLQQMSTDPGFVNTIHSIGGIQFHVLYWTPDQIKVFNEYVRLLGKLSAISIDASGRFIKSFEVCPNRMTGHVYLYTVTIKFERKTICVCQMVTEVHTEVFLELWLRSWKSSGIKTPGEVWSDYQRAIPTAACVTFNEVSLKVYVDMLFTWAVEGKIKPLPVKTLIRIDVSHVMSFVSNWKCLKKKDHPYIKNFFLHCIALLIDTRSVDEFKKIFLLVCIVASQPYDDTYISTATMKLTVSNARKTLEEQISDRRKVIGDLEASMITHMEEKGHDSKPFEEGAIGTVTHQWIKKLIESANSSSTVGYSVNAFYLPALVRDLERLGKEFPLWTAAALPIKASERHASTSHQEGYFAYLRKHIFQHTRLPCSGNRFVAEHCQSLISGTNLLSAKLTHFSHQYGPVSDAVEGDRDVRREQNDLSEPLMKKPRVVDDSDLLAYENWKGLKTGQNFAAQSLDEDSIVEETFSKELIEEKSFNSLHVNDSFKLNRRTDYNVVEYEYEKNDYNNLLEDLDEKPMHLNTSFASRSESVDFFNTQPLFASSSHGDHSYSKPILTQLNSNPEKTIHLYSDYSSSSVDASDHSIHAQDNDKSPESDTPVIIEVEDEVLIEDVEVVNKRRKELEIQRVQAKGFYFQNHPETAVLNERKASRRKGFLLINGLQCKLIEIKNPRLWNFKSEIVKESLKSEIRVNVIKTCGFDSLVHILQFSALDSPLYHSFIQQSDLAILKFTSNFLKTGLTKDILFERFQTLNEFYAIDKQYGSTCIHPYILDAEDFMTRVWSNFLANEPSGYITYECSIKDCQREVIHNLPFLSVNDKIVREYGFGYLQKALLYHLQLFNVKCRQLNCKGTITETTTLNIHICIDLDVRNSSKRNRTTECALSELPVSLELDRKYRLAGVVHYQSAHFVAYCLRSGGNWLKCDDLQPKVQSRINPKTTVISPQIAIYILE